MEIRKPIMAGLFRDLYNWAVKPSPAKVLRRQAKAIAEADRVERWKSEQGVIEREIKTATERGNTETYVYGNKDPYLKGRMGYKWARSQGFKVDAVDHIWSGWAIRISWR